MIHESVDDDEFRGRNYKNEAKFSFRFSRDSLYGIACEVRANTRK